MLNQHIDSTTLGPSLNNHHYAMSVYKIVTLFCVFLLLFANRATGISIIHDDRSINFVSLTCTDDFSVGPVLASFYYNSSESGLLGQPTIYHNLTLNKTNEGRYTCKTTTIDVGISDPLILIRKYYYN